MSIKQTHRLDDSDSVEVRTLRVDIVAGPGTRGEFSSDNETMTLGSAVGNDVVVDDDTVSRYHVEFERCSEGIIVRDQSSSNGTFVGASRIREVIVPAETVLQLGRTTVSLRDGAKVDVELHGSSALGELVGSTTAMRRLMAQVRRAAQTDVAALVVGESGTGKELVARALYDLGPRQSKPFVTVDCASLAPSLIASELFGHERGAFTGADRQHIGAFERANGGTLFLDEVGELPAELQPNLLGALERRRIRRVGGQVDIDVDARVIAATNRDLRADVNAGRFRLDLYYRLAVVVMRLPPLRERTADLPLLLEHFLRECGDPSPLDVVFPAATREALRRHHWPGNVRELKNLVEAAVAMGEPNLPHDLEEARPSRLEYERYLGIPYKEARQALLRSFEVEFIEHWLERTGGNVARAAREARMDRSHLFHLIRRHRLR